jgi:hypothetical protein
MAAAGRMSPGPRQRALGLTEHSLTSIVSALEFEVLEFPLL